MVTNMGLLQEFHTFIKRGNVLDMAVGVIVGAAFGKIVSSMVDDLLMPIVGLMTAGMNFANLALPLGDGPGAAVLKYGNFVQRGVDFLITAFCVFLLVKIVNSLRAKKEAPTVTPPPEPTPTEKLLEEIRDLLAKR